MTRLAVFVFGVDICFPIKPQCRYFFFSKLRDLKLSSLFLSLQKKQLESYTHAPYSYMRKGTQTREALHLCHRGTPVM